jgi:hypothetical protein
MTIKKTGRKRYRVHTRWSGTPLMVLQLEWIETGRERWSNDGGMVECDSLPNHLFWRDATLEDLTEGSNHEQ